ncbi:MAG: ion channel [Pseudomonadales bacterium]|jgi:hypothetical protein
MLTALLTSILLVMLVVLVHYEMLHRMTALLPRIHIPHQFKIVVAVIGAMIAHVIEIWIFALGYYVLIVGEVTGMLKGDFTGTLLDCGYYSFITYTSLGFGDIIPTGYLRFITGIEALTGLLLIAWTASFVYVEMRRFWDS